MFRNIALIFCILSSQILIAQEKLVPCQAALTLDSLDLTVDARLVENLNIDLPLYPPIESGGWPMVRIIIQPGWENEPESAISLYLPDKGDGFIEAVVANEGIAGANTEMVPVPNQEKPTFTYAPTTQKRLVKTVRHRAGITRELGLEISNVLAMNVRSAKFPDDSNIRMVLHGTEYSFVSWILGLGFICGETSSPDDGTLPADLVQLADQLFKYTEVDDSHQVAVITEIKKMITRIKSRSAS